MIILRSTDPQLKTFSKLLEQKKKVLRRPLPPHTRTDTLIHTPPPHTHRDTQLFSFIIKNV